MRAYTNLLYLLLACHLFEGDVCVGCLYNFIWMDMRRLEFPEYQHRIITFLISDSFLRSSNVREEMAGRTLTQHLPLKRLNMRMVTTVKVCSAMYLLAFPVWVFFWGVGWGRLLFCLYLKTRKLNSKRKLVELWKYLFRTQLDNHCSRECEFYLWMLRSQQRVCYSNHRSLCPCRIPQGTRALVAPRGTIPPGHEVTRSGFAPNLWPQEDPQE